VQDKNAVKVIRILACLDLDSRSYHPDFLPRYISKNMYLFFVLGISLNAATGSLNAATGSTGSSLVNATSWTHSTGSSAPFVSACDSSPSQLWSLSNNKLQSLLSSSCLSTVDCNPIAGGDVSMISCSSSHCNAANNTNWLLDSEGRLVSGSNTNLCLTLANVNGPDVNLWQCEGAVTNGQFDYWPR